MTTNPGPFNFHCPNIGCKAAVIITIKEYGIEAYGITLNRDCSCKLTDTNKAGLIAAAIALYETGGH